MKVVVSADDFGLCPEVDEAICLLNDRGIVQRTCFLVNSEHFQTSAEALRRRPLLEVAIHLNLTDGRPVLPAFEVPTLVNRTGAFRGGRHYGVLARIVTGQMSRRDIKAEWTAQIARAKEAGIEVGQLTSHGHLHLLPQLREMVCDLLETFAIPSVRVVLSARSVRGSVLRLSSSGLIRTMKRRGLRVTFPDRIIGLGWGGAVTTERIVEALATSGEGTAELIVHPALGSNDYHRRWHYAGAAETEALLSEEVALACRAARIGDGADEQFGGGT